LGPHRFWCREPPGGFRDKIPPGVPLFVKGVFSHKVRTGSSICAAQGEYSRGRGRAILVTIGEGREKFGHTWGVVSTTGGILGAAHFRLMGRAEMLWRPPTRGYHIPSTPAGKSKNAVCFPPEV